MTANRRKESLIPLSREHHYGLMLCLRVKRGLQRWHDNDQWLEHKAAIIVKFLETDLLKHFRAEEDILFPAIINMEEAEPVLARLIDEHGKLEQSINRLRELKGAPLASALGDFAELLEGHIRAEERELFPIYERYISQHRDTEIGRQLRAVIGEAMRPATPEVLEE